MISKLVFILLFSSMINSAAYGEDHNISRINKIEINQFKDDELGKVLEKYEKNYDFISSSDYRGAPKPLHNLAYEWPEKDIHLEYWAMMRIFKNDKSDEFYHNIIKEIFRDLDIREKRIDKALAEFAEKGEAEHFDFYYRVIRIKELKKYIKLEFYLDKE